MVAYLIYLLLECREVLSMSRFSIMKAPGQMKQNYVTGFFTTLAMARDIVKKVSYNLHGLNNGHSDLCNDLDVAIIAVQ